MAPLYTLVQDADPMDCDFLVVSINSAGAPGNLNRAVMKRAGYPEEELPGENDLRSGYFLLNRPRHKPILFIVVNPEGEVREQLPYNLYNGLLTYLADLAGKRVWLPLLGTGAGRLAYAESLALTTRVIESLMGETRSERPQFILSVPGTEEGLALLEERDIAISSPYASEESSGAPTAKHWLINMGVQWREEDLEQGKSILFQVESREGELSSDAPTQPIRPGDKALAYLAYKRNRPDTYEGYPGDFLWAEMMVMEMVSQSSPQALHLIVLRTFYRPISLARFKTLLPNSDQHFGAAAPYEAIIPLSEDVYNTILSLEDTPFVNHYLPFVKNDINHRQTDDQLGFDTDIDAFASIIRQADVKPPLAIGLFGNWGSGKSFFMEKLEERIADPEKTGRWNYPEYVEHVVPVRFNSWHYSDANLWASMIMHIFGSLNEYAKSDTASGDIQSIYAKLNVAKAQIAETQKALDEKAQEAAALEEQKRSVEQLLREKKETLGLWKAGEIMQIVFEDKFVQEDIRTLEAQFDTKVLGENLGGLKKRVEEAKGAGTQISEAWKDARKYSRGGWLWVWLVVLAVGAACLVVFLFFREEVQGFLDSLTVPVVMLASGVAGLFAKLSPYLKKANGFYQSLKGLVHRIETKKSKLELQQEDVKKELETSIQKLTTEKDALEGQKSQAEAAKKALEQELADIASGKRLGDFLAGRSADDAYAKQLGIVSWIRKDFEELNRHFEQQREMREKRGHKDDTKLQIDRIVLYIDDLDRCNEDVVVKVLEAIHLLLAFPLFVVVVGVDPRWLNNALTEKYKTLFQASADGKATREEERSEGPARGAATSYDYLEKIFQIPFALKPITKEGREDLLRYLAQEGKAETGKEKKDEKERTEETTTSQVEESRDKTEAVTEQTIEKSSARPQHDAKEAEEKIEKAEEKKAAAPPLNPKQKLTITADELTYMQGLSALFAHTPRTANRYVNIYRLIKAHGGLQVSGPYEIDEFAPILFLLAVVVGYPECADAFIAKLRDPKVKDTDTCGNFLNNCGIAPLREKAKDTMGALETMHVSYLRKNLPLVARFSFRTLMRDMG